VLVTIRTPIVDLRAFCRPDYPHGIRLPATWSEDKDFVRYFGPITKRLQGPVDPWTPERVFCRYDRALRFGPSYPALITRNLSDVCFYGMLRRLYPATVRNDLFHADLQIAGRGRLFSSPKHGERFRRYAPVALDLSMAVETILSIPANVRSRNRVVTHTELGRMGAPIAQSFDAATTIGHPSGDVIAGKPAVAIELDSDDTVTAKSGVRWKVEGLELSATTVMFHHRAIPVFVIERPSRLDHYPARTLRAHLLRFHAEREYLRRMVELLAKDRFIDSIAPRQLEAIQGALNSSLALLTRIRSFGHLTQDIAPAFVADRTLSGAELETLMDRIQPFRPVIRQRLERLLDQDNVAEEKWNELLQRLPEGKGFIVTPEVRMSQYNVTGSQIGAIGDNASSSSFSFANQINLGDLSSDEAAKLETALQALRQHLVGELATQSAIEVGNEFISPAQIGSAIGALSEAEEAVMRRDAPRAENALRRCGRWLISFADGVGVELAAAAIRAAFRLP
jgi:hypothetical protein